MNIDFSSLEKRYGTLLASNLAEEIARADQRRFSFYRIPFYMKALQVELLAEDEEEAIEALHSSAKVA